MTDQPVLANKNHWSPVWLMPIIALVIAIWLGWKAWQEQGIAIKVVFYDGSGIEAGRTPVRYHGLQVGKVETVTMNPDLQGVTARIEMNQEMKPWLTTGTDFWLVHPEISMAGVSGLETLLSGNYVTLRPGQGKPARDFRALDDVPPLAEDKQGLRISLHASSAASLTPGSPVYYRRIAVGEVTKVTLAKNGQDVRIELFIKPEYAPFVRLNSLFWNISGFRVSGTLPYLQVQTDSLLSILKGGIAFSTPEWEASKRAAIDGESFHLYSDYDSAQSGIPVRIEFPLSANIVQEGSRVMFHGIETGVVKSYEINPGLRSFVINVSMNPLAQPALVEGAVFWLVDTRLTPRGLEGIDALISGRYIAMDVTQKAVERGREKTSFIGHLHRPPASLDTPGLHLKLRTDKATGLSIGSEIWLKGITIGTVNTIQFASPPKGDEKSTPMEKKPLEIELMVHIEPEFQHLVRKGSKFWNTNGLNVTGSLVGFKFHSLPLESLVVGGITCEATGSETDPAVNGDCFPLYPGKTEALQRGRNITLFTTTLNSIRAGNPVMYRGVQVGEVSATRLADPANQVEIDIFLEEKFIPLVTKSSQFWNISGVSFDLGLFRGLQVRTASMLSLLQGGIAFATPACEQPAPNNISFPLHTEPDPKWLTWNPLIRLDSIPQAVPAAADR